MSGLVYLLETRFEQRFSILFIFDPAVKSFYVVFFFKLKVILFNIRRGNYKDRNADFDIRSTVLTQVFTSRS